MLLPRDADGGDGFSLGFVEVGDGFFAGGEALGEPRGRVLLCAPLDGGLEEAVGARSCFCVFGGKVEEVEKTSIASSRVSFDSLFLRLYRSPRDTTFFESRSKTTALAPCVPTSRPTEKRGMAGGRERGGGAKKGEWFFLFFAAK